MLWRDPDGTIVTVIASADSLTLDPPGLRLSLHNLLEEAPRRKSRRAPFKF